MITAQSASLYRRIANRIRAVARHRQIPMSDIPTQLLLPSTHAHWTRGGQRAASVRDLVRVGATLNLLPSFLVTERWDFHAHAECDLHELGRLKGLDEQVGARVRFALNARRITVQQAARVCGIDAPSMSQRVNGHVSIRAHELFLLSAHMGFSYGSFLGEQACSRDSEGYCRHATAESLRFSKR